MTETGKQFAAMTVDEQRGWLAEFQQWLADKLPRIESVGFMTGSVREAFEQGLMLLSAFSYCKSFTEEALRFKDYENWIPSLRRYADQVASDVQTQIGNLRKVDLHDPSLLVPHVGRPTLDEAAARQLKAEQDRQEAEAKEETLFGKKADIPTIDAAAPASVSGSVGGGGLLHLDQLKWLLSPELAEAVETIRDLRSLAEENSTRAKVMAEMGAKEEDVEPFATAAVDLTAKYERIYERVDEELAHVYVRLKEDTAYIAKMKAMGVDPQEKRTELRPYWDKVADKEAFKAKVIEVIKANDPEQKAIREAEEKKKKEVDALLKYLQRKDKPNTPKRIETMEARYQELIKLIGEEEAKVYRPVVDAAIRDCEENVKPAIAAKKEAKKAHKKSATKSKTPKTDKQ